MTADEPLAVIPVPCDQRDFFRRLAAQMLAHPPLPRSTRLAVERRATDGGQELVVRAADPDSD